MIQYKYNGSHNDEWYLESVKKVIVTVLSMPEKMQQYLHLQVPTPSILIHIGLKRLIATHIQVVI